MKINTVLTIAGSDSIGGAGIQADIKTITCNGCYAMSAVTALTAQNTLGVSSVFESSAEFLADQIDAVFCDIVPDAVKIGMVSSSRLIEVIAEKLEFYGAKNIVLDPVMVATSGSRLIDENAVDVLEKKLFPLARIITPNIPEAEILSGIGIDSSSKMEEAAGMISEKFRCSVLLKGGHSVSDASDFLHEIDGKSKWFAGKRIDNPNTHGTGCTLSSAIASCLAKGMTLEESVGTAKEYISNCLEAGLDLGKGSGPLMHNFQIVKNNR